MKALKLLITIMIIGVFVVGCSTNNSPGTTSSQEVKQEEAKPSTTTETASETPTPEPTYDLKGQTVKLGVWWDGADPRTVAEKDRTPGTEELIKLIEEAEKKYNCKIEYVKFGDYGKYVENFTTTSLAGEPFADAVVLELFWAFPQLVNKGFITPIDQWLDMSDDKYIAWMKDGGSYNGKQYGFIDAPPSPYGIFYNKTLVEQMGLEDPYTLQQSGEWTWDKFRELMKKATKDTNGDGKTDVYGMTGAYEKTQMLAKQFIYTNKGTVADTVDGQMKFTMDQENAVSGLQFLSDLYNVDKSIMQPVPEDASKEFVAGKGVMYAGFSWEFSGLKDNMKDKELGYVFFPKGPKADKYTSFTAYGNMYMISKYSKNAEATAHILSDISLGQKDKEFSVQSWQTNYPTPELVDTRTQMYDNISYMGGYYAVPDSGKLFEDAVNDITERKVAPATAVEKIKNPFEAGISKLMSETK
ncbi:ABC transporter substrate-binding protein [Paenibacillus sp. XY044]|uniref:ABC transporter substrate-binding protein n=1 Tax=Paenibacillus sp. XY044 TaxID=2026089 RepID=UPI000B97EA66|nr:extracellular solute-binding protein [Paenibacillus sp. XY044]OZB91325.1 hypothetical protein CJP46_28990 [Paenibacillus sp. XY044]